MKPREDEKFPNYPLDITKNQEKPRFAGKGNARSTFGH
jgi:hypothetical protein